MSSAYDNDPRVTNNDVTPGDGYVVDGQWFVTDNGTSGWLIDKYPDGEPIRTAHFETADEAIHSRIGDPQ
jgi:hypothetical protein